MATTNAPFRIIVYSAGGVLLGETSSALSLQNQSSLDKIGTCTFSIPAADPIVLLITAGVYFDIYDEVDGYIGRFYFRERNLRDTANGATLSVSCFDNLTALQRSFVGYRRKYTNQALEIVVANLLAIAGWTGVIDTGIGNTTVDYEGESVFAAVDVLRDRWNKHWRLGTVANQLEFGAFGADSGLLLQNLQGQVQALFQANRNVAHVSNITENINSDGVYNCIIATSGGTGSETELTLQNALVGSYTVRIGTNQDGTHYYYIQDDTSVATYGLRTKVVKFTGIHPLSNNATDVQYAVDATKYAAEAYLTQHKDAIITYSLDVVGLHTDIRVGDVFHLDYRSIINGSTGYLDADAMLYLMDITYQRDVNGQRHAMMTGCTTSQRKTADTDVMVDVVRDISVLKLHVQPYPYWSENTWQEPISSGDGVPASAYPERPANFKVEIDNSVMKLTKVRLRFKTFLLSGTTTGDDTNGLFVIHVATHYPTGISLYIDGINRTAFYGGPWNPEPGNAAVDVTLDITDDIVGAAGGFAQDHSIVFHCAVPANNQELSVYVPGHSVLAKITLGWIQANIRIQGVTQGIIPT